MSDLDVGKHGTFHSEQGDVPCKIVKYVAGRPHGDHLIEHVVGYDGYAGVVTRTWSVAGKQTGAFEVNRH